MALTLRSIERTTGDSYTDRRGFGIQYLMQYTGPNAGNVVCVGEGQANLADFSSITDLPIGSRIRATDNQYTTYIHTTSGVWSPTPRLVSSTVVAVDVPSVAANSTISFTVTVTGAVTGDAVGATAVLVTPSAGFHSSGLLFLSASISAANTIKVVVSNPTAGAIDPASSNWLVLLVR